MTHALVVNTGSSSIKLALCDTSGRRLWQEQRPLLLTARAGLEASTWLHLLQDGDPVPHLPQPLRRLRRRLRRRWR